MLHTGEFRVPPPRQSRFSTPVLFAGVGSIALLAVVGIAVAAIVAMSELAGRVHRDHEQRVAGQARAAVERRIASWKLVAEEYGFYDQTWDVVDRPQGRVAGAARAGGMDWFRSQYGATYFAILDRARRPVVVGADTGTAATSGAVTSSGILEAIDRDRSAAGLVASGGGVYLVAGAAVMRTGRRGPGDPTNGYVVLVAPVGDRAMSEIAAELQQGVQVLRSGAAVAPVAGDSTEVRIAVTGLNGEPTAVLVARAEHTLLAAAARWLRLVLIAVTLVGGLAVALSWGVAHRAVVRPARDIGRQLQAMRQHGKLAPLVAPSGSQEWVAMAATFNATVEALGESEFHLRRAQKMEAVGTLAGGLAHDFNNTLAAVLGAAALLRQEVPEQGEPAELVATIETAARRSAELTRQLLSLSRPDQFRFERVRMDDVVTHVTGLCGRTFDRSIRIVPVLYDTPPVQGDAGQLEQALLNLCINARDAMPAGGTITIELGAMTLDTRTAATVRLPAAGTYVRLLVTDTGTGMSEDVQRRLFEPFFTTKPAGRGTGLGLTMVYGAVRAHHGGIRVSSSEGHGSRFEVFLPLAAAGAAEKAAPRIDARPRGSGTVLVVDDEEAIRRVVGKTLTRLGYRVIEAANGAEALDVLAAHGAEVAAVLLDMMMPEMSGQEAFPRIRRHQPGLPVVVMTGFTKEGVIESLVEMGAEAVLTKPFEVGELARVIRAAVDSDRRSSGELRPRLVSNDG